MEDETVWLSQKLIAQLFEIEINTVNYHIKELYKTKELQEVATIRKFRIVQTEGSKKENLAKAMFTEILITLQSGQRLAPSL